MRIQPAIPVYAVLSTMKTDYAGGFAKLGAMGWQNIELLGMNPFAGKHIMELCPVGDMKRLLKQSSMTPISFHERVDDFGSKKWDQLLSYCDSIDCRKIVLPSIWIKDEAQALALADDLDKTSRYMSDRGFTYVLHTHHLEFRRLEDGRTLVDVLLENTDQSLELEFDIVWSMRGGVNPLEELEKFGPRCQMVHLKDYRGDFPDPVNFFELMEQDGRMDCDDLLGIVQKYSRSPEFFCTIGEGCCDIRGILQRIRQMGHVQYVIAESEAKSGRQFEIAKKELDYINQCLDLLTT